MNRIPENTIERILAGTDIVEVVRSYDSNIKKAGQNYKSICPFHDDKDPSLVISPAKQIYKCFSCGAGGNAISFVMNRESVSYPEAIKILANRIGEQVEEFELTGKDKEEYELKNECKRALKEAALFYHEELKEEKNKEFLQYAQNRMDIATIEEQLIGYANGGLYAFLKEKGFTAEILNEAGLINIGTDGSIRDKFYKRILFPIRDVIGNVIAFTARSINSEEKTAKYINSKESIIYHKGNVIYGLDSAKKTIVKNGRCFLVEGNMDVLTLQSIGITNVIALSGTALSDFQISLLTKYTSDIYIIADTDEAGIKALNVNAQKLIQRKCEVTIVPLPEEYDDSGKRVKYDADSFFKGKDEDFFYNYVATAGTKDYVLWLCEQEILGKELPPATKTKKIKEIVKLISCYESITINTYIDMLSDLCPKRKNWEDAYKNEKKVKEQQEKESRDKEIAKESEEKKINPEQMLENEIFSRKAVADVLSSAVDKEFYLKYGFYSKNNEYYFEVAKEQFKPKSNFIITPIAHIMSDIESRRVYYILNRFNKENIIDLKQEEMISVSAFKKATESKGNYIFKGDLVTLDKLKEYLYEDTLTCREISTLGWNKKSRFYGYGNGILKNNEFIPVDEFGIVKTKEENYFLPAYSKLNNDNTDSYIDERTFSHKEREYKPTFKDVSDLLMKLYKDHAKVVLTAYIAVCFKDIIVRNNKNYPIINIFGIAGSGKTAFCKNFMYFFGYGKEFNETKIDSTTYAAIATYIDKFSNAFVYLDEYKNGIGPQKMDLLKAVWGSAGRKKSNLDNIGKTIQTKAECGLLMSGQELCTSNPALYTRTCTEKFFNNSFTSEESELFDQYEELAKDGLTHITNHIISFRDYFEENFMNCYNQAMEDIKGRLAFPVNSRILQNWTVLLASLGVMQNKLNINLEYKDFLEICINRVIEQNKESDSVSEIKIFWDSVLSNIFEGKIRNNYDFVVQLLDSVVVDEKEEIFFETPKRVLFLNTAKVFEHYVRVVKGNGESFIPPKSMKSYLENANGFIGNKKGKRFSIDIDEAGLLKKSSQVARSMVFDYDRLNIQLLDNKNILKGANDEDEEYNSNLNLDGISVQKIEEKGLFDE